MFHSVNSGIATLQNKITVEKQQFVKEQLSGEIEKLKLEIKTVLKINHEKTIIIYCRVFLPDAAFLHGGFCAEEHGPINQRYQQDHRRAGADHCR